MYGDSHDNSFEILAFVIILGAISFVCGLQIFIVASFELQKQTCENNKNLTK